jgi:GDP-4-dehydro-6-deoxy-D-mannose reductase
MRCLVTGAGGLIGTYLVEFLLGQEQEVCALVHAPSPFLESRKGNLLVVQGDIVDRAFVKQLLKDRQPETVFHLAAQSLPAVAWEKPEWTFRVNVLGTINLFEAVRAQGINPLFVVACSSSEYAVSPGGRPIAENDAMGPSSLYAVSKMAQDHLSRLYHKVQGLRVVRARPFFLIGPRKTGDMASDFARGIVAVERGIRKELPVGNLDIVRDLLDVRDGVEGFWIIAEEGRVGDVYNVCSGRGYSIREVLDLFKSLAKVQIHSQMDPAKLRPIDEMVKVGDPAKLMALGWSPKRSLSGTLKDVLEYWRAQDNLF